MRAMGDCVFPGRQSAPGRARKAQAGDAGLHGGVDQMEPDPSTAVPRAIRGNACESARAESCVPQDSVRVIRGNGAVISDNPPGLQPTRMLGNSARGIGGSPAGLTETPRLADPLSQGDVDVLQAGDAQRQTEQHHQKNRKPGPQRHPGRVG